MFIFVVKNVVCLSFLSNEGNTDIFYDKDKHAIETFIYFSIMEDETIVDKEVIIISNNKSHIIIPNSFVVGYHECELSYCSCTYNEKNCFFNGNVFS